VIGVGKSPVGKAPAGLGVPDAAPSNAGTSLVDANGVQQSTRLIDPVTGQYVIDERGRYVGVSAVAQRVQLALTTTVGSASVYTLGIDTPGGVIGNNFVSRRRATILQALAGLVKEKAIEVVDITIDASVRPIYTQVRWRDLTTEIEQTTQI